MKPYTSREMRRFNHLHGEIEAEYHNMNVKLGVSDSAMRILYTICDNGDSCMLQEICRRSGVSKQTINSAIRKLEAERIVYLEPAGARNKRVCLTKEGRRLAQRTAVRVINVENEIFNSWTKEDIDNYLTLTKRFLTDFQEKTKRQ